jgi:hypothetical protein
MRQIKETDLIGKTIKHISQPSVNVVTLTFEDDSAVDLVADWAIETPMGLVAGIFLEEKS